MPITVLAERSLILSYFMFWSSHPRCTDLQHTSASGACRISADRASKQQAIFLKNNDLFIFILSSTVISEILGGVRAKSVQGSVPFPHIPFQQQARCQCVGRSTRSKSMKEVRLGLAFRHLWSNCFRSYLHDKVLTTFSKRVSWIKF